MKISLVQFNPVWEDKSKSMLRVLSILQRKSNLGDIAIFPEMTLTGFSMNASSLAEKMCDETFVFFSGIARKYQTNVFAGLIEKENNNFFNSLIHIDSKGKLKAKYRKIHPFTYSKENKFYKAGNEIVITKVQDWRIGLSICYDLRFPELFRLYTKEKIDLIINIANWPDTRVEHWRALLKARAIENQCYVAGVNRAGDDPKLHYNGFSSIINPMGKEIVIGKDKELILTAEIEKDCVKEIRKKLPFLNDIKLI